MTRASSGRSKIIVQVKSSPLRSLLSSFLKRVARALGITVSEELLSVAFVTDSLIATGDLVKLLTYFRIPAAPRLKRRIATSPQMTSMDIPHW